MPCDGCKKKGIPMKCNFCPGSYCSRCICLESHNCKGLERKINKDRHNLKDRLHFEPPRKLEQI